MTGDADEVGRCLSAGVDVNFRHPKTGITPVMASTVTVVVSCHCALQTPLDVIVGDLGNLYYRGYKTKMNNNNNSENNNNNNNNNKNNKRQLIRHSNMTIESLQGRHTMFAAHKPNFHLTLHVSTRLDTFDVSSESRRACRAVLFQHGERRTR